MAIERDITLPGRLSGPPLNGGLGSAFQHTIAGGKEEVTHGAQLRDSNRGGVLYDDFLSRGVALGARPKVKVDTARSPERLLGAHGRRSDFVDVLGTTSSPGGAGEWSRRIDRLETCSNSSLLAAENGKFAEHFLHLCFLGLIRDIGIPFNHTIHFQF